VCERELGRVREKDEPVHMRKEVLQSSVNVAHELHFR